MQQLSKQGEARRYALKAVIDIGSTSIRMVVAEILDEANYRMLDTLTQSVSIGNDSFTRQHISSATTEACVSVLRNFSAVITEYGIDPVADVRAVATSAVREAKNRNEFTDRILMATGMAVDVISGPEVNRLTYFGIQPLLERHELLKKGDVLFAEVGGGSTELIGLKQGRISSAHTYRLGAYRLREKMELQKKSGRKQLDILEMELATSVRQCHETIGKQSVKPTLVLMGGEARLAADLLQPGWNGQGLALIRLAALGKLAQSALECTVEKVAQKFDLPHEEAQTLGPAWLTCIRLAQAFKLKALYICGVTLRCSLVAEMASGRAWREDLVEQILHSAHEIRRRYDADDAHAHHVQKNALAIYRALQDDHQLDGRHEVILSVAALLHDIGSYIGSSSHHKHSKYLIENSGIFGLGMMDIKLAALVARYHRGALPQDSHYDYQTLPRPQRMIVSKLAPILRIADALDRSHTQAVHITKIGLQPGQLILQADMDRSIFAEKHAVLEKSQMMEKVYGRSVSLCAASKRKAN